MTSDEGNKNVCSDELDQLIKEAMSREMEAIVPPPAEKLWAGIIQELDGKERSKGKGLPKGLPIKQRRHVRFLHKFAAVAAMFFLAFVLGRTSVLSRLTFYSQRQMYDAVEEAVPPKAIPPEEAALGVAEEAAPPELALERALELAPLDEEAAFEDPKKDNEDRFLAGDNELTVSEAFDADEILLRDSKKVDLLPWVETLAGFQLFLPQEVGLCAKPCAVADLHYPGFVPEGFILKSIYFQGEADNEFAAYFIYRYHGSTENFFVISQERLLDSSVVAERLQHFQEAGDFSKTVELKRAERGDAFWVHFDSKNAGLAWAEGELFFTVFGSMFPEEAIKIAASLERREG